MILQRIWGIRGKENVGGFMVVCGMVLRLSSRRHHQRREGNSEWEKEHNDKKRRFFNRRIEAVKVEREKHVLGGYFALDIIVPCPNTSPHSVGVESEHEDIKGTGKKKRLVWWIPEITRVVLKKDMADSFTGMRSALYVHKSRVIRVITPG
ncbi:hypothetical protein L210DRAFT_136021 [Boletus edulis BED1]|uniref:Uncharacterized protein n=1 Tax=Boletus edulis BED1 TaxID=1328754 RepID=A0AAD4BTR6_BOLED|nr:hypothetical protein L210DRAFT_136021 [Boletus edulis BED1]